MFSCLARDCDLGITDDCCFLLLSRAGDSRPAGFFETSQFVRGSAEGLLEPDIDFADSPMVL